MLRDRGKWRDVPWYRLLSHKQLSLSLSLTFSLTFPFFLCFYSFSLSLSFLSLSLSLYLHTAICVSVNLFICVSICLAIYLAYVFFSPLHSFCIFLYPFISFTLSLFPLTSPFPFTYLPPFPLTPFTVVNRSTLSSLLALSSKGRIAPSGGEGPSTLRRGPLRAPQQDWEQDAWIIIIVIIGKEELKRKCCPLIGRHFLSFCIFQ